MLRLLTKLVVAALPMASTEGNANKAFTSAIAPRRTQCFADSFRIRIERGLAGFADVIDIPGISVGIVRGDSLVYSGAVGFADRSAKRAATADTPFNIASLTKLFTATLAVMLVNEGTLDLDAPVSKYLPDSVHTPRDARGRAITVRSLLSHTSGLPSNPPNRRNQKLDGPLDPGIWEAYNVSDLYKGLAATTLKTEVGKQFQYSNYGFALLGHVIERVTRRPYEQVLRERLLTPLDMRATAITLTAAQQQELAAFYWSEDLTRTEQHAHARFGEVAGFIGLTSTVRDLAKFVEAHLNTLDSKRNPVPPSVVTQMQQPRFAVGTDAISKTDMGFAWFLNTLKIASHEQVFVTHSGEVDGHTAEIVLNPAEKIGVIVLQNLGGNDGTMAVDHLTFWLEELALKEQASCRS